MWQVWMVTETSHEWIEWVPMHNGKGETKDEALRNGAKGLLDSSTRQPIDKLEETAYRVCLPDGEVPCGIPFEKSRKIRVQ